MLAEIKHIAQKELSQGAAPLYVRNILKEYLQAYVLFFVYTTAKYKSLLIFTGGTCLRRFYNLPRLSEDLDFDFTETMDAECFRKDMETFFKVQHQHKEISSTVKHRGQQVLLKFSVLRELGLARKNESDLLNVRVDLSPVPSKNHHVVITTDSLYGFNYAARHYDLPDLFAGKLHAILMRRFCVGTDQRPSIKGRDYFDLLWFMKQGAKPNLKRLSEMLGESLSMDQLVLRLDQRVREFSAHHQRVFKQDMIPLLKNPEILDDYVKNYQEEYTRFQSLM